MNDAVLLDTCVCLWLMHGDRMSVPSRQAIRTAQSGAAGVHVSAITAWEVATLVRKGRYRLLLSPEVWFAQLLDLPGIRLAALAPDVLMESVFLPGDPPPDPADRMIAATARRHGHLLITRDRRLLGYGDQGHVRALAC